MKTLWSYLWNVIATTHIENGFLFKSNMLCILKGGLQELLIQEILRGGLARYFRVDKTYSMLT